LGRRRKRGRRRQSSSWRKGCRRWVTQGIIDALEFAREAPSASILTSSSSYPLWGLRNITPVQGWEDISIEAPVDIEIFDL
jgi:hypothetical protein